MNLTSQIDNYTIEQIPSYRRQYIESVVSQFLISYSILKWPVDCVKLLKKICDSNSMPLQIATVSNVSDNFDAVSIFNERDNSFQIILNNNKINYPFQESKDRRLNFTIAHELGHIFLGHLTISDKLKTEQERYIEDLEANEFASKLLMPQRILLNCNFSSVYDVADFFNVSISALSTRMHVLRRLDLLNSNKGIVCKVCGNSDRGYSSKYCMICGSKWEENESGILKTHYTGIEVNSNGEAITCPKCDDDSYYSLSSNCSNCGALIINTCCNVRKSNCNYHSQGSSRYCEICGSKTSFFVLGYLKPWYEEQSMMLADAVAEGAMECISI
ncbi:MAG: ImmA/IrrE family metallo-endopeptidase [Bacillota bacterium]|nr:ImmA/IrrE family metallo-endopeptidase [Bacillota bacterium]